MIPVNKTKKRVKATELDLFLILIELNASIFF